MHHSGSDDEAVAQNAQRLLEALPEQRVGPDSIEIGKALEEIRGGVGILEANRRPDGIQVLALCQSLILRQDRGSILAVENEITAVLLVVRVLLQPSES